MQEWKSQQVQKKKLKKFKQQNGGITAQEGLEGKFKPEWEQKYPWNECWRRTRWSAIAIRKILAHQMACQVQGDQQSSFELGGTQRLLPRRGTGYGY